jgi:hypothetical protein
MHFKALRTLFIILALGVFAAQSTQAASNPKALARLAISENPSEAKPAIAELRNMGQPGVDVLFEVYGEEIKQHMAGAQNAQWSRISAALDAISRQRNSYTSRLYWYTDLNQAQLAAKETGKPILSLRLLGNLDEEYSCANSRFFRTVLYANTTVADVLRERFVLHWKSVRPAPRVTIDYGDGRKLERTLTGNSIHYILDANGRVVDALPGLYGPQGFLRGLSQAEAVTKQTAGIDGAKRAEVLSRYHKGQVEAITKSWAADAVEVGAKLPESIIQGQNSGESFDARVAGRTAMSKAVTEMSIINAITYDVKLLQASTDEEVWDKIAKLHGDDARLGKESIALIRSQSSTEQRAAITDEALARLVSKFEHFLAFDTVRNEYTMHATLHAWLASGQFSQLDVEKLNERVYSGIFLTPGTDPWLGLYSPDTYTALENGGITK